MGSEFTNWSPNTSYVQSGLVDGTYTQAAHTLLAAGPPRLANIGGAAALSGSISGSGQSANQVVFPMGLVQNFTVSQQRNATKLFEIGSERSYSVMGRSVGSLQLGRVLYHGGSLLRVLYAYYQDLLPPTLVPPMFPNAGALAMSNPHDVKEAPGYENLFFNLASDLFTQPVGILMYVRDVNEQTLGAYYFESCYVPTHNLGFDAQSVIMQESCSVQFERATPVQVQALSLITSTPANNAIGANLVSPGIAA